jgi:hypothetical protein
MRKTAILAVLGLTLMGQPKPAEAHPALLIIPAMHFMGPAMVSVWTAVGAGLGGLALGSWVSSWWHPWTPAYAAPIDAPLPPCRPVYWVNGHRVVAKC